ncbi:hypothetical protein PARPLA_00869 [Rhodobacteraceae bacterium THAF1]|nr:hypothetical protein PARPLA_00869 [Rhodobacteraceae bacterium THAF1]
MGARGFDHRRIAVGRHDQPPARRMNIGHRLRCQNRARADQGRITERVGQGGNGGQGIGRVQRHLDPVDPGVDQRLPDRHDVRGLNAPQDCDDLAAHVVPFICIRAAVRPASVTRVASVTAGSAPTTRSACA